jgi:hypothetical protein
MPHTRADVLTLALVVVLCVVATGMTLLEPVTVLLPGLVYQGF